MHFLEVALTIIQPFCKALDNVQGFSNFKREKPDFKNDFPKKNKINKTDREEKQGRGVYAVVTSKVLTYETYESLKDAVNF